MEPSARVFIEALIQIPELSVSGYQIQSQAVLIFVEVQVAWGGVQMWGHSGRSTSTSTARSGICPSQGSRAT